MPFERDEIGFFLKQKRLDKNLTLEKVAEFVGVTKATVSRWESNEIKNMKTDKINKLCACLDIPIEDFLYFTDDYYYNKRIQLDRISQKPNQQITQEEFEQEIYSLLSKHVPVKLKFKYSAWLLLSKKLLNSVVDLDENQKKQIASYLELFKQ